VTVKLKAVPSVAVACAETEKCVAAVTVKTSIGEVITVPPEIVWLAVMLLVPPDKALASPAVVIVATVMLVEFQFTADDRFCVLLSV